MWPAASPRIKPAPTPFRAWPRNSSTASRVAISTSSDCPWRASTGIGNRSNPGHRIDLMTRLALLSLLLASRIGYGFPLDDDTEIYRPGPGVSAPKVIHKVDPRYTPQARRALVEGTAVLEVVVDEHG